MSDYIGRNEAIEAVDGNLGDWNAENWAVSILMRLPSADVEPVVRCKDCHFFEQDHWETVSGVPLIVAHNICTRWGRGCQTAEDGFCYRSTRSQGARTDGEQDDGKGND